MKNDVVGNNFQFDKYTFCAVLMERIPHTQKNSPKSTTTTLDIWLNDLSEYIK